MSGSEDQISALPDGVLQHVLGFLPVHDAVRTSVLAARWRHAWRSMRRLRISPEDGWNRPQHLKDFLDALLPEPPSDHGSILQEARLDFDGLVEEDDAHIQVWIRRILSGQAQVLSVSFTALGNPPLVSRHLRKLELTDMALEASILDLASCPALEDLTMASCILSLDKISSQSVKRLSINGCDFLCDCRPSIATPSLVWLLLDSFGSKVPLLGSTPSLKTALVRPAAYSSDCCKGGDLGECYGSCAECTGDDDHSGRCVLLGGLSTAINLELLAHTGMRIFGRDLRWCPTFSNLKILLLNDWCVSIDLRTLLCILEHSPVLEKLTLRLSRRQEFITVLAGNCYPLEKLPAISEHLNTAEIRCRDIDGRVCRLLKFLS